MQIIEWIREVDENADRLATENRSVLLWERELARMLELEHSSSVNVGIITTALTESHYDSSHLGLLA